jgi:hypothetical protein
MNKYLGWCTRGGGRPALPRANFFYPLWGFEMVANDL